MSEILDYTYCDEFIDKFEKVIKNPIKSKSKVYYTGVDLGTACVVIAVLDENFEPVAGAYRYADVVRDGMVVDYIGAVRIVKQLKEEIEEKLGTELIYAEQLKMWYRVQDSNFLILWTSLLRQMNYLR